MGRENRPRLPMDPHARRLRMQAFGQDAGIDSQKRRIWYDTVSDSFGGIVMSMRGIASAVVVMLCCVLAWSAFADSTKAYQLVQTDRNVALFHNLTESVCVGLRIVFGGEVSPTQAIGIGAEFELASSNSGRLVFEGVINRFGTIELDWPLDGARVEAAFWISADGTEYEIDVHSPYARMWYVIPPGTDEKTADCVSYVPIDIEFRGNWSKDPDGLPLDRYRWSWSDGMVLDGPIVERTFRLPGWYTVILTVWDIEGLSHSISDTFYIYQYRCED